MLSVDFSTLHFLYASLFVCLFVFYWKVLYHLRTVFSLDMSGRQWISSVRVNISAKKNIWWSEIALVSLVYFVGDVIGLENWRHPFSQSDASRTNRKLIACVVPRLGYLACIFLEFSLATLLVTSWEIFLLVLLKLRHHFHRIWLDEIQGLFKRASTDLYPSSNHC